MMITAKIIADSLSLGGVRLTTLELTYPRFIHSEFMTHRMFSRNASSSRAIPIEKTLDQVRHTPAFPVSWGVNKPGMQATEELCKLDSEVCKGYWWVAAMDAVNQAKLLNNKKVHKQVVNRLLEPFTYIKVIVSSTEYTNFFNLREHPDAQPEMKQLAVVMREAMDGSIPVTLHPGQWHLPYVHQVEDLADDIKCSVARCARVSYLNHDSTSPNIEKDIELSDKLLAAGHMSPFEHQATPMEIDRTWISLNGHTWEDGMTHLDKKGYYWSGNFRGWVQHRQTL